MAKGNINLHIGSSFDDQGFRRLDRNVKVANKTIGKFGHSFGSIASASHDVAAALQSTTDVSYQFGGSLGNVAKAAAPILGGILSMGVWGAVIGAIGVVVGLFKKFVMLQKDARLAAKGMSAEYLTIEYRAKRYREHLSALVAKHSELVASLKEAASLANAKDEASLDSYRKQVEYSLEVAEAEGRTVAQIAEQAKLKREAAALDAKSARMKSNAKVNVEVKSPEPVEVPVKTPAPVKVTALSPAPVGVETVSPNPISVTTITPKPVNVRAEAPAPVEVKAKEPKPVKVTADAPSPVEIETITPKPVNVRAEAPAPVEVRAKEPKPVKVTAEKPEPVEIEMMTAHKASQNFEQESAWHIEAVTKMANAEIALTKAEADRAIALERVEVAARTRALESATQHYGSTSSAAIAAQRDLIAAQEKMARTIEKSSLSVEKSQKSAEDGIMRANLAAARQRAKNAAAMVEEARAEGKVALESAREAGKEQIRAAESAVKIAKQRVVLAESDRERALSTHDRKTARDREVAQFDVDEKERVLKSVKGRARGAHTTDVIKAEAELSAAQRNLTGITKRAAITRRRLEQDGDIKVSKAQTAFAQATNELTVARLNAANNEREVSRTNAEAISAVKRQARILQELADYKAKEIQTARRAQALNEKSVRENAALDARIAAAKTAAAKWQEEMARVHQRDGQGRQIDFNVFQRREKQRAREQKRDEARGKNIDNRAESERDRLQGRIFDRNGKLRKSANKQDIARWQELNRFIEMRRGNNPAQKVVDALERQKAKNVADIAKNVAMIQQSLGQLGL